MREPYFPVFKSIIDSTLWSCKGDTIKVFFTLCGKADPEGFVSATADGIRRAADMPLSDVQAHLAILESPDLASKDRERDPSKDGRRIEKVTGGWRVMNVEYYRDLARQESIRASKRKWWNENRSKPPLDNDLSSTRATDTKTETETKTDPEPEKSLSSSAASPDAIAVVRRVFDRWRELHHHPAAKLDAKRTARIRGALKTHAVEQLETALAGALKDDWLMGRDPKSPRKYDGLETILRDAAQIERLIELEQGKGGATPRKAPARGVSLQRDAGVDVMKFFKGTVQKGST
jgi:hypothetical protein